MWKDNSKLCESNIYSGLSVDGGKYVKEKTSRGASGLFAHPSCLMVIMVIMIIMIITIIMIIMVMMAIMMIMVIMAMIVFQPHHAISVLHQNSLFAQGWHGHLKLNFLE